MKYIQALIFCFVVGAASLIVGAQGASASNSPQDTQNCVFLSEAQKIPDDGSWVDICLVDSSAPDAATLSETNLKVLVDHPDVSQLEIQLTREHSDIIKVILADAISKEGIGLYSQIHDFDGLPSQGEWIVRVRDVVPGITGDVKSLSISCLYSPGEKRLLSTTENDGKPTAERIAPNAIKIPVDSKTDDKEVNDGAPKAQLDSPYSVSIMAETFEGVFPPSTGWSVYDANPNDGMEYFWDDDDLKPFSGWWAAWPARGGANGMDPTSSTTYPANMDTWMIYGPFDLSNAKSASVAFKLWRHIEVYYDHIFFGISSDGIDYFGEEWDGSADWQTETFDLSPYLGDNSVWIGWRFFSDGSVQYEGPWVDDITLNFEPGDVTVSGDFRYADRSATMRGANAVKVQLWDWDTTGSDLMAETYADIDGNYSFPAIMNWDLDDPDPNLSNRRLDLYVLWVLENNDFKVTDGNGFPYAWVSPTYNNIGMGNSTISGSLPDGWTKFWAMWFYQDIRKAREYYMNHTNPQVDPGVISAHWDENQNSENGIQGSHFWAMGDPHVYIAHDTRSSPDMITHEIGHNVMWNKTGQWLWYEFGCFDHEIFSQESTQCAWSEGWADYFAIAVTGDACLDFGTGPCTGPADILYYDLENHTRNDPDAQGTWWGDGVEGRVAGTLYDLMDAGNEAPWYDSASWGFDPIVDIALVGSGKSALQDFWNGYQGTDKHNGIRSIYQNTIDYDSVPEFTAIPDQYILQNFPYTHLVDLWDYSSDLESPDASLTYQIVNVSDSRCGISLDSHWVNASPQMDWSGVCYVTVSANDSIKTNPTGSFWMVVQPINSRNFLPVIMDN